MTILSAPQKRRLTSLFGLLALVAISGALALNRSASADPAASTTSVLLQPPGLNEKTNPAKSIFGTSYNFVTDFTDELPRFLFYFAGTAAILAFFAGAYSYFLSGGNEDSMNKGRTQMLGSLIAFIIIAGAGGIVSIFTKLFSTGKPF